MNSEMSEYVGIAAVALALAFAWFRMKKPVRPAAQHAAAPPIPVYQPVATPDLLELSISYAERRKREEERAAAQRNLDALYGIAKILGPEPVPKS